MKTEKYTLCCSCSFFIQENVCPDWGVLVSPNDCAYYGAWACPLKLETLSYTEGDICHKTEMTVEEFVADIRSNQAFHQKEGGWLWIDCRRDTFRKDLFIKYGLGSMTTKDKEVSRVVNKPKYERPSTRGELVEYLHIGIACEVVSDNVSITCTLIHILNPPPYTTRPSHNKGWSVFETIKEPKEEVR